jgi:hypothetical protein
MQELISILMIFILLTCLSGCTSTKIISKYDLPLPDSSKNFRYPYVVHTEKSKFLIEKSTISNGILSGTISQMDKSYHAKNKIHLYLSSDSAIKIDKGEFSVSTDQVIKVEVKKPSAVKTTLFVTYCVAGLVVVGLFLYFVGYVIYLLISVPA